MKTILAILLGCSLPVAAWATSCSPRPLYDLHTYTHHVYPDSVFWLDVRTDNEAKQLDVRTLEFQRLGARGTGYQAITQNPYGMVQLRPKKPLQIGVPYTFTTKKPLDLQYATIAEDKEWVRSERVRSTHTLNSFMVEPAVNLPLPAWKMPPQLHYVGISDSTLGEIGTIQWKIKTNLSARDYYVYVTVAKKADFSDAQGYFTDAVWGDMLRLEYGGCIPRKKNFGFQYNEAIWAKFDLISHKGDIVPWQGEPMKFELQETKPVR